MTMTKKAFVDTLDWNQISVCT